MNYLNYDKSISKYDGFINDKKQEIRNEMRLRAMREAESIRRSS